MKPLQSINFLILHSISDCEINIYFYYVFTKGNDPKYTQTYFIYQINNKIPKITFV